MKYGMAVALTALVVGAACGGGDNQPMSPDGVSRLSASWRSKAATVWSLTSCCVALGDQVGRGFQQRYAATAFVVSK